MFTCIRADHLYEQVEAMKQRRIQSQAAMAASYDAMDSRAEETAQKLTSGEESGPSSPSRVPLARVIQGEVQF